MTDRQSIEQRLADFIRAYEGGDGDPLPFMEGLNERERRRFRLEVNRYLEGNPEPKRDLSLLDDARFARTYDEVVSRLDGASGAMPGLLVELREGNGLLQQDVVEALSGDLDASPAEAEKIDDYYHDLEFGNLPARGISGRVFDSLARILGTTSDALRRAGEALGPSGSPTDGLIYTRMAEEIQDVTLEGAPAIEPPSGEGRRADPPDRIDRLFTGE